VEFKLGGAVSKLDANPILNFRVVIFEQPFETTLVTTSIFSLFIDKKQWREKKEEREQEHDVNMRDKVVKRLFQSGCTNIFSLI